MARAVDRSRLLATGAAVYRVALRAYPHGFLRSHGDELEADFEDQSRDALAAGGTRSLCSAWCKTMLDLAFSVPREWLRTPWLLALCAATAISIGIFVGIWGRGKWAFTAGRAARNGDSIQLLFLMLAMVLIPIIGILVFWWTLRLTNLRAPRWRRRV